MTTPPASGPDALALRRLRQVVAMGEREGSYTSADCVRLAELYLPNPHTLRRAYLNERVRADRSAASGRVAGLEIGGGAVEGAGRVRAAGIGRAENGAASFVGALLRALIGLCSRATSYGDRAAWPDLA